MPSVRLASATAWGGVRRRAVTEAGFSLIEVLASALMLALMASAAAAALISTTHLSADQRYRAQADSVAVQDQERLRGMSDEQLAGLDQRTSVTLDGRTFSVHSTGTYQDSSGDSGCASTAASYYKIASTVSWSEQGGGTSQSISEESLLSRPVSGDLRVSVTDQTGAGIPGTTVSAGGASTQSATADTSGCVLFAGLAPGAYNVTMSAPGYVDRNGTPSPLSATATVTSSGVAVPTGSPFTMGLPGKVVGTFATTTGVGGEADGISWMGSGVSTGMSAFKNVTSSTPATQLTTGSLYPFNKSTTSTPSYGGNYVVWGGRCLGQEPPTGYDQFGVAPGATLSTPSVQEPLLDVLVTYKSGTTTANVKPGHVKLTYASASGDTPACSDAWYPTISPNTVANIPSTGWLAHPGQPFASTATTGTTASGASTSSSPQSGTLTVCADYTTGGTTYKGTSTTNTNSNFTGATVATVALTSTSSVGTC